MLCQYEYNVNGFVCLIWFFRSESTIFQLCQDGSSWVEPVLSNDKCVLLKDTTQWHWWGFYPWPLRFELSTLPLSHCATYNANGGNQTFVLSVQSPIYANNSPTTVKPVLWDHSNRRPKLGFKTDYCLMQVKNIAECSKGEHSAILLTWIKR